MLKIFIFIFILFSIISCAPDQANNNAGNDITILDSLVEKQRQKELKDSLTIKELEKYFTRKKDEFDPEGRIWWEPKDIPKYTNRHGIYCYFQTNNGKASNLRIRIQYVQEGSWLFIRSYKFVIDGAAMELLPDKVERENDAYEIWEWTDQQIVSSNDVILVAALSVAKSAKMKIEGEHYEKVRKITSNQIQSIRRTLRLFEALGGSVGNSQ